jgi:hypothetical protein
VGAVTLEHMGATEWLDDATGYHPDGKYEMAATFCSQTPITGEAIAAVRATDLDRVAVLRPIANTFFGEGLWFHSVGVPTIGYIAGPSYLCSYADHGHLDKLDKHRMNDEVLTFAAFIDRLQVASAELTHTGDTTIWGLGR